MRITLIAILLLALPGLTQAQSGNRADTWEWSLTALYQDSQSIGGDGGSSLKMDHAVGIGFGLDYNFNSRLALGFAFDFLRPDYKATLVNDADSGEVRVIDHTFDQFNTRVKATYNFIDGPLTPFVEAGLGWTYMDSRVADGPPTTGCWWHPFWGYICNNYYDTYSETSFSYGGAVGMRFTTRSGTILKLSYEEYRVDNSGSAPDPTLSALRFNVGWRF